MSPNLYDAETFDEFWVHYQAMHSSPRTRAWHAVATASAIGLSFAGIALRRPSFLLAAPLADYAIAQLSHRRVEGNRTSPTRKPLWHARAELRLFRRTLRERFLQ